jgi:hypothetical protein
MKENRTEALQKLNASKVIEAKNVHLVKLYRQACVCDMSLYLH